MVPDEGRGMSWQFTIRRTAFISLRKLRIAWEMDILLLTAMDEHMIPACHPGFLVFAL